MSYQILINRGYNNSLLRPGDLVYGKEMTACPSCGTKYVSLEGCKKLEIPMVAHCGACSIVVLSAATELWFFYDHFEKYDTWMASQLAPFLNNVGVALSSEWHT